MIRQNVLSLCVAICLAGVNTLLSQTWTNAPNSPGGYMIACSADGTKFLVGDGDSVYTSTNSGITWSNQGLLANAEVVAVSANGGALYLSDSGNFTISTNSGVSWIHRANPPFFNGMSHYQFITSSADGSRLVIGFGSGQRGAGAGPLYSSTDFGNTWVSNTAPITNWQCAACSADGSKWFAATYGGAIYATTNPAGSWNAVLVTNRNWMSLASSADGTRLLAGAYLSSGIGGGLLASTDSGAHWQTNSAQQQASWVSVASSADGSRLLAVGEGGSIISSTDFGATWPTNTAPALHWGTVCMTADGAKAFAAPNPLDGATAIYRSIASPPKPTLTLLPIGANLTVSWPVSSTNLALQSSADLTAGSWQTLTNLPVLNSTNLQDEVILSLTDTAGFFRLVTQ